LGDAGYVLRIDHGDPIKKWKRTDERAQPQRAKKRPCCKVAEHGVKAPTAHQWNDNASRTKYNERIAVGIDIDRRCHSISLRSVSVHAFALH
jgi:hypothetical protein